MYEETSEKSGLYDIPTAIANAIRKFGQDLQVCIPAIVTEDYDPETDLVKVVPLTKRAFSLDGNVVQEEADEFTVAVKRFGIGKFLCVYPIKKGTTGWVFSSDRDTYGIKEKNSFIDIGKNEGPQDISSFDMGKYTQGFFIPDRWVSEEAYKSRLGHASQEENDEYDFSTSLGINLLNEEDKKRGVYLSDDCKATILNDKNQVVVDASAEDSISTKMKLEDSLATTEFDGETINITLSNADDPDMENSGIEITIGKNGQITIESIENRIEIDLELEGKITIESMEKEKRIEIDLGTLPEGEVMQIEPMWFPINIADEKVSYEKRNVIVGSTAIESKEDPDKIE